VPLLLFYFDGHSTKSIAETLGTTQAAIQARLSRGRKQLRQLLQTEGAE
jgi:DNA-directed RNA polymerase specialized sigma24 family protein